MIYHIFGCFLPPIGDLKPRSACSNPPKACTISYGHKVLDACAGLWCVNAGHCRDEITSAIHAATTKLDFEAASKIAQFMPAGLDYIFLQILVQNLLIRRSKSLSPIIGRVVKANAPVSLVENAVIMMLALAACRLADSQLTAKPS